MRGTLSMLGALLVGCAPVLLSGCATATPAAAPSTATRAPRSEPAAVAPAAPPRQTMRIEGLTGSLPAQEVQLALSPRNGEFAQCFLARSERLRQLSGDVRLFIRVGTDGRVERAFPEDSTLGDREVERCVTDVATGTRFPRPRGGSAEVRWPLHIDPPEDVRHPATWDAERVANLVEQRGADVVTQCMPAGRHGSFQITAYVRGSGRVVSAGAAVNDETLADAIDCVASQVRGWRMSSTRRMAKVTFAIEG